MSKVGKIPARMIEDIPAEKIPELVASRDGYRTLSEHLNSIKAWIDAVYAAIPKDVPGPEGGTYTGPIVFAGGASIPSGADLIVDGNARFFGVTEFHSGVSSIANVKTQGLFGVNAVVASVSEAALHSTEWRSVVDFTPTAGNNYLIYIYVRVKENNTNIGLTIEYNDAGGLQTQSILDNSIQNQGSYIISPIFINVIVGHPIKINVQADKPDQVFISASIVGL